MFKTSEFSVNIQPWWWYYSKITKKSFLDSYTYSNIHSNVNHIFPRITMQMMLMTTLLIMIWLSSSIVFLFSLIKLLLYYFSDFSFLLLFVEVPLEYSKSGSMDQNVKWTWINKIINNFFFSWKKNVLKQDIFYFAILLTPTKLIGGGINFLVYRHWVLSRFLVRIPLFFSLLKKLESSPFFIWLFLGFHYPIGFSL